MISQNLSVGSYTPGMPAGLWDITREMRPSRGIIFYIYIFFHVYPLVKGVLPIQNLVYVPTVRLCRMRQKQGRVSTDGL